MLVGLNLFLQGRTQLSNFLGGWHVCEVVLSETERSIPALARDGLKDLSPVCDGFFACENHPQGGLVVVPRFQAAIIYFLLGHLKIIATLSTKNPPLLAGITGTLLPKCGGTRQSGIFQRILGIVDYALDGLPAFQDCLFPVLPLGMDRGYDNERFKVEIKGAIVVKTDGNPKAFDCVNNFHEVNDFVPDFGKVCDFGSSCGLVGRVVILYVSQVASNTGDLVRAAFGLIHRTWPVTRLRVQEGQARRSDYKVQGCDPKLRLKLENRGKARNVYLLR